VEAAHAAADLSAKLEQLEADGRNGGIDEARLCHPAGRATAKANGTKFGRKPKLTPHQVKEIIRRIDAGESQAAMARTFNVNQATISRLVNQP
jgi:hypothetical protein